jgi:hypothetical protein
MWFASDGLEAMASERSIWAALVLLLLLTLALAYIPVGKVSPAVGIVIATIKAGFVVCSLWA